MKDISSKILRRSEFEKNGLNRKLKNSVSLLQSVNRRVSLFRQTLGRRQLAVVIIVVAVVIVVVVVVVVVGVVVVVDAAGNLFQISEPLLLLLFVLMLVQLLVLWLLRLVQLLLVLVGNQL